MSAEQWAHVQAQVLRFVRVSALAFAAAVLADNGRVSWASLWALGAGALETGLREMFPVKPLPAAGDVLKPPVPPAG